MNKLINPINMQKIIVEFVNKKGLCKVPINNYRL